MRWSNSVQNRERLLMMFLVAGLFIIMLVPELAFAGEKGEVFDGIWNQLCGWVKGGLGRLICGSTILAGAVAGAARQSLTIFGVGIGSGVIIYKIPEIVKSIIGATISVSSFGTQVLEIFSNGLN